MPVQRRLDTYYITDWEGRLIETFQIGADGTAAVCASEAHLLDRAIRRVEREGIDRPRGSTNLAQAALSASGA